MSRCKLHGSDPPQLPDEASAFSSLDPQMPQDSQPQTFEPSDSTQQAAFATLPAGWHNTPHPGSWLLWPTEQMMTQVTLQCTIPVCLLALHWRELT